MGICKQGWPFVNGCLIAGVVFLVLGMWLAQVWPAWISGFCFAAAAYCAFFFRDPRRVIPQGERLILAPADGKVVEIVKTTEAGSSSPIWLVRIFLSVFDPHIQRAPLAGQVKAIKYTKGLFLDARHPQAHFENEQNRMDIIGQVGSSTVPITVTQIAGLIARRIVCWAEEGQSLSAGEQFGLIRFGSQVDITFPGSANVRIKTGDRVLAGESVLAEVMR